MHWIGDGEDRGWNCRNHTTVFTQEREWATARQEDVGRSGPSVCSTAICILSVIFLGDNRVRVCGIDLVTFNIHPNQPKLVEGDFGHPFQLGIGLKRNSNFTLFGIVLLVFPPQRRIANTGPRASNTPYNRPKATFQGEHAPLDGHSANGSAASRSAANKELRSPTNMFHAPGEHHLKEATIADNSAV